MGTRKRMNEWMDGKEGNEGARVVRLPQAWVGTGEMDKVWEKESMTKCVEICRHIYGLYG